MNIAFIADGGPRNQREALIRMRRSIQPIARCFRVVALLVAVLSRSTFGQVPSATTLPTVAPMATNTVTPAEAVVALAPEPADNGGVANPETKYLIATGDQLSFTIVQDGEAPRVLVVNDSGEVDFPYAGHVPVVGRTCQELAGSIKAKLEATYYYHATVIITVDSRSRNRGRVYLAGAVHSAGAMEIPSDEVLTLSKAIFRAGGFSEFADERKVRVTRRRTAADGIKTFIVNVKEVMEKGKLESDLPLQPGDLIFVPERFASL